MEGIMGRFFYQFGVTVAVAVLISYMVSMTLTPMLSARILREHAQQGPVSRAIEKTLTTIEARYRAGLALLLAHRKATMGVATLVLLATFGLAKLLKTDFIPAQDMSMAKVTLELPAGTPQAETQRAMDDLTRQAKAVPGVTNVFAVVGAGAQEEVNKGELTVNFVPIAERSYGQQDLKAYLRRSLRVSPAAVLGVQDFQAVAGGGNRAQKVQFNLRSTDWETLLATVEKVTAAMRKQPGFVDIDTTYRAGKPQLSVDVDRERAAAVGVPAASLGQALRALMGGDKVTDFHQGGDTYDIKVKLPEATLADPSALGAIPVRTGAGQLVELRSIADVRPTAGPSQLEHQAQLRQVTILADLGEIRPGVTYSLGEAQSFLEGLRQPAASTEEASFLARAFARVKALFKSGGEAKAEWVIPATVTSDFEGQGRELKTAGRAFIMALLLGIVLVYIILAAQFESLIHPFTIMMSLPFALIGGIGGLLVANQALSMMAMIGFIMLMGLVTKNGILLVEFTNQLRHQGKGTMDALLEAGQTRLRPILMTTVAMIAGMVPVALARGDGAETRVPMAVAIIGGLITSTVLTLGIVPVVYSLLDDLRGRLWKPMLPAREAPAADHHDAPAKKSA
jgi:HAE1 family hydrophobic/amphiphilic exporter-1